MGRQRHPHGLVQIVGSQATPEDDHAGLGSGQNPWREDDGIRTRPSGSYGYAVNPVAIRR